MHYSRGTYLKGRARVVLEKVVELPLQRGRQLVHVDFGNVGLARLGHDPEHSSQMVLVLELVDRFRDRRLFRVVQRLFVLCSSIALGIAHYCSYLSRRSCLLAGLIEKEGR